MEELIAAGANVNIGTPAHPISKRADNMKKAHEEAGENPDEYSIIAGQTPLHIACARRDDEMIDVLMANQADPSIENAQGFTPIDYLDKSYDERKKIVDSISGTNNFVEYSRTHASQEHLDKCKALLNDRNIKAKP